MRIVSLALVLTFTTPADAAEVVGGLAMGCTDAGIYRRIARMGRAGDGGAAEALITAALADGSCRRWPAGLKVRIEEARFGLACVSPMGSTEACRWLEAREVQP